MNLKKLSIGMMLASGSLTVAALSQAEEIGFGLDARTLEAGAFTIVPTLSTDFSHTDNMFLSDEDEVSSNLLVVSPEVYAIMDNGNSSLSFNGKVDAGDYSASDEDDYTDWLVGAAAHLGLSGNSELDFSASRFSTHEARGTGFSQGGFLPSDPDEYDDDSLAAAYEYGTDESFGRFVLSVLSTDKTYTNNRDITVFRDREDMNWSGTLFLNMAGDSAIMLEYSDTDIDYVTDPLAVAGSVDTLDSNETAFYVGITWDATASTTGTVKIGRQEKDFDDADRIKTDSTSWQADVIWEPLTYSAFTFSASKQYGEASGVGDALLSRNQSVSWLHQWNEADTLMSTVFYSHNNDEYTQSTREDKIKSIGARLDYNVRRWASVYASYSMDDKTSTFDFYNYEENVAAVGFQVSL